MQTDALLNQPYDNHEQPPYSYESEFTSPYSRLHYYEDEFPWVRRWTPTAREVSSSAESHATFGSHTDGPAASDEVAHVSALSPAMLPNVEKPLPPTPSNEHDRLHPNTQTSHSKPKRTFGLPVTGIMRNVRRVASFGPKKTNKTIEAASRPKKAKKSRTRSPPERIIYAEKGTQTSFEYLPATATKAMPTQQLRSSRKIRKSSSEDESPVRYPLATITESFDRPALARLKEHSLKSFLGTSPSDPSTPTPYGHESNPSYMDSEKTPAASAHVSFTPQLNLDLVRSQPVDSRASTKTVIKGSSDDSMRTYESKYSNPAPGTPDGHRSSGIAVTSLGVTERPTINRKAASDSIVEELRASQPDDKHEPHAANVSNTSANTPTGSGLTPKFRPGALAKSPRTRQRLARQSSSSIHLSPLRNMLLTSSDPEQGSEYNQHNRTSLVLPSSPHALTPMQMSDLDRPSPVIFRRPVEGYFAIPPVNVHEVPDHLQGSLMCPLHPQHRGGQQEICSLHGHLVDMLTTPSASSTPAEKRRPSDGDATSTGRGSNVSADKDSLSSPGDKESKIESEFLDFEHVTTYRSSLSPSPLRNPHSPGPVGDLGISTAKAARVLMGSEGVPGGGDASRFELAGPDHNAGDLRCPARNGKGICVWHGRTQAGAVRAAVGDDTWN